jgi:hypothetical protein
MSRKLCTRGVMLLDVGVVDALVSVADNPLEAASTRYLVLLTIRHSKRRPKRR